MKLSGTIIIVALVLVASCRKVNGVYERMSFFPKHEWSSSVKPSFDFVVSDTAASYRLYFVLRHTDAYRYKNIWVNITVKSPDTTFQLKREFTLSDNEKWHGTTVDDIVEQRIPFGQNDIPVSLKKGNYTFTINQVMREDPLQNIMNAGIRVEKAE